MICLSDTQPVKMRVAINTDRTIVMDFFMILLIFFVIDITLSAQRYIK